MLSQNKKNFTGTILQPILNARYVITLHYSNLHYLRGEKPMKTTLLTAIAVCLVLITFKLYVPDAQAAEPRSRAYIQRIVRNETLSRSDVQSIVRNMMYSCNVSGYVSNDYISSGSISC